jgi:hypothetical protein
MLFEVWGFKCTCSQCASPPGVSIASDDRIAQIHRILDEIEDAEAQDAPAMAELLISLFKQERMDDLIYVGYTYAAIIYNSIGEIWTAQKYASLAIEGGILYPGPHHKHVKDMETLLKDPESHWSWMSPKDHEGPKKR